MEYGKARKNDKQTAKLAASGNQAVRKSHVARCLEFYQKFGPMTHIELGEYMREFTNDWRVRSNDALKAGWVASTGKVKYHSARPSTVWKITPEGRKYLKGLR